MANAMTTAFLHGAPVALADIPRMDTDRFRDEVLGQVAGGARIAALFGRPQAADRVRLYAVLAHDQTSTLSLVTTDVADSYPALTPDCPQAHWFEREIAEQWGVVPREHPWLKPIRFHRSYRAGHDAWSRPATEVIEPSVPPFGADFFRVDGHEVHEVAVGPVHAGVIEPGHFRFQCHGEHVFHLEISLGYQHRGLERALVGGPDKRTIHLMEQVAGDTSVGHTVAYCQAIEGLAGAQPSLRCSALGRGTRAGTAGKPHGGPGRPGGRRWIFADGLVLRTHPRRFPECDRSPVRQQIRAGPGSAGGRGLRR